MKGSAKGSERAMKGQWKGGTGVLANDPTEDRQRQRDQRPDRQHQQDGRDLSHMSEPGGSARCYCKRLLHPGRRGVHSGWVEVTGNRAVAT